MAKSEQLLNALAQELKRQVAQRGQAAVRGSRRFVPEGMLVPAANFAVRELRRMAATASLSNDAWRFLRDGVLARLVERLQQSCALLTAAAAGDKARCAGARASYGNPSAALLELIEFFPGAADIIALTLQDWTAAQLRLLRRLRADRRLFATLLPQLSTRGRVTKIELDLSDVHGEGDSVTAIHFESGGAVIYKPRSGAGERIWFSALRSLNAAGFPLRFHIPRLLLRPDYFWMTFVRSRACSSRPELHRFYLRWGAQIAIAHLLGYEDLHRENWIAMGAHPVLLDGELVRQPQSHSSAFSAAWSQAHPLLRTGLLPLRQSDGLGKYDRAAPFDGRYAPAEQLHFWPRWKDKTHPPRRFKREICAGYARALQWLSSPAQFKRFSAGVSALEGRIQRRVLYRSSAEYDALLRASWRSHLLLRRDARAQFLRRAAVRAGIPAAILQADVAALLRGSIPRYTSETKQPFVLSPPSEDERRELSRALKLRLSASAE